MYIKILFRLAIVLLSSSAVLAQLTLTDLESKTKSDSVIDSDMADMFNKWSIRVSNTDCHYVLRNGDKVK